MTCKNIRGCKKWKVTELEEKNRLSWACEVPGSYILGGIEITSLNTRTINFK